MANQQSPFTQLDNFAKNRAAIAGLEADQQGIAFNNLQNLILQVDPQTRDAQAIRNAYEAGNVNPLVQFLAANSQRSRSGSNSPRQTTTTTSAPNFNQPGPFAQPAATQAPRQVPAQFQNQAQPVQSSRIVPDFNSINSAVVKSQVQSVSNVNLKYDLKSIKEGNAGIAKTLAALSHSYKPTAKFTEDARRKFVDALRLNPLHDASRQSIFQEYVDNPMLLNQPLATAIVRGLTEQSGSASYREGSDQLTPSFLTDKIRTYQLKQTKNKKSTSANPRPPTVITLITARKPTTTGLSGAELEARQEEVMIWKKNINSAYNNTVSKKAQLKFIQECVRTANKAADWFRKHSNGNANLVALIKPKHAGDVRKELLVNGLAPFSLDDLEAYRDNIDVLIDNFDAGMSGKKTGAKNWRSFTGVGALVKLSTGMQQWLVDESFGQDKRYSQFVPSKNGSKLTGYSTSPEQGTFWQAVARHAAGLAVSKFYANAGDYEAVVRALGGGADTLIGAGYAQRHALSQLFYLASFFGQLPNGQYNVVFGKNSKKDGVYAGLSTPKLEGIGDGVNPTLSSLAERRLFATDAAMVRDTHGDLVDAPAGLKVYQAIATNDKGAHPFNPERIRGNPDQNKIIDVATFVTADAAMPDTFKNTANLDVKGSDTATGIPYDVIRKAIYAETQALEDYTNALKAARGAVKKIKA